ncbi:hypothetical protein QVD17_37999 [Tagetes erecta]|uniref:Uncharacterized protein n=1 Tax=Tagetes erecta TaxID=13708 RepID=A0AAD8ND67_TARER|nr:hypothetical protein QVD17_37999 [Tagetes erecta]
MTVVVYVVLVVNMCRTGGGGWRKAMICVAHLPFWKIVCRITPTGGGWGQRSGAKEAEDSVIVKIMDFGCGDEGCSQE